MQLLTKTETAVELLDTTLREGEQTPGVAFMPEEKLEIARLLLTHLRVDRLEIGSARISDGEQQGVRQIVDWAEKRGFLSALEMLGFVDGGKSVQWLKNLGVPTVNLLCKASERHCRVQLRRSPSRHLDDIVREIEIADQAGLKVNVYLEDWSHGVKENFGFIHAIVQRLKELPVERIMLADTLGILTPDQVTCYLNWMYAAFGRLKFDFHAHNDYNLATANALAAVNCGISGLHGTINGLGERAGNPPIAQLAVAVNDFTDRRIRITEKELQHASNLVQNLSGKRCAWNMPVVGRDVYTQTCGIHADGDEKGDLYANALRPERFGRERDYALGKLSGRASLQQNLELLPELPQLSPELRELVLKEVVRLGDKKKSVTRADLSFIISGLLQTPLKNRFQVVDFELSNRLNRPPKVKVVLKINDRMIESCASGDGGYDAFVKAVRKALRPLGLKLPRLLDYEVRIPPGGRTDALVETTITWQFEDGRSLITNGVDCDQMVAAIRATEKMLNLRLASGDKSAAENL